MPLEKSVLPFFRSLSVKAKPPVEVRWPEEPLDLPVHRRGGFYNAFLGALLNSRYRIVRKLGWGQHASVWLAQDVKKTKYFAIKILTAHATQMQSSVAEELGILRRITEQARKTNHPGHNHVLTLRESFELSSAHGRHLCLVHDALGVFPALFKYGRQLPIPLVKHVSRQLLEALDFLHCKCHVIHTDIKPDNILVVRNNIDEFIKADELSAARAAPNQSGALPNSPANAILSSPLNVFTSTEIAGLNHLSNFDVRLTDYSTAALVDGYHANEIQPFALRAPEVILGSGWGASADIWNLGCLVFEFLTGRWLFNPRSGQTWTAEQYHLAHMPGVVGEDFDLSYFHHARRFLDYFKEDGGRLRIRAGGVVSLEGALKTYGVISDGDADGANLVAFLRSMLRLNPSDRATAGELLRHKWLS